MDVIKQHVNEGIYIPDKWVILKITLENNTFYKVLAGWSSSYVWGGYWRMNSGITTCKKCTDHYLFHGRSGSVYKCHNGTYGFNKETAMVMNEMEGHKYDVRIMEESTDWENLNY